MTGHATKGDEAQVLALEERLAQDPTDVTVLTRLGALMFEPYHKPDESMALLRRAIAADPNSVDARFWLAKCLFHYRADSEATRATLAEALAIDPHRPDCLSLMAAALQDLGHGPEQYVDLLRTAAQQAPGWPSPRHQLAQALVELGQLDEASAVVREALGLVVTPPPVTDSLEEYTEDAVTGRARTRSQEELERLLTDIERRRARRSLGASPGGERSR